MYAAVLKEASACDDARVDCPLPAAADLAECIAELSAAVTSGVGVSDPR